KEGENLTTSYDPLFFPGTPRDFPGEIGDIEISNDVEYASIASNRNGLRFVSLISMEFYKELKIVRIRFIITVAMLFLFASLVTYLSMRLNYNPVKKLFTYGEMIKQKINIPENDSDNTFDSLIDTLNYLFNETSHNRGESRYADESALAKDLIQGKISSAKQICEYGEALGEVFAGGRFFVFTLHLHLRRNELQRLDSALIDRCIRVVKEHIKAIVLNDIDLRRWVFSSSISMERQELEEVFENIHRSLQELMEIDISIGVGGAYQSVADMAKSYQDSLIALDYMLIKGANQIIYYEDTVSYANDQIRSYPFKLLDKLYYRILQLDRMGTKEILSKLISCAGTTPPSTQAAQNQPITP
ncbi:MAG: hypothetical protein MI862_14805, partial [Desulfobacterales bacterium]|nr:hypothetical protein [Desulfobacterales bacterium]